MSNAMESGWHLRLSRKQRLELIATIWDSLAEGQDLPVGEALVAECERRLAEMKSDPATSVSWEDFCERRGWKA